VSVNLSSADFIAPGIIGRVCDSLGKSGIDPGQLHLEITERLLMSQPERARAILEEMHELGLRIAIDDFGTGYSSLSYLHSFPIDVLKIDRSFVAAMRKDTRSMELVRSIVSLGKNLGIKVIAEGVETREEAAALAGLGCDQAQGYYFAKPLPEDGLAPLLTQSLLPQFPLVAVRDQPRAQAVFG
jgi:EAL domain-containing protein (putative c-di-GMP-specific phosphodiesterase class I)